MCSIVVGHNTTDYDYRHIFRVAGRRREVRRDIAQESPVLTKRHCRGDDIPAECPLLKALGRPFQTDRTASVRLKQNRRETPPGNDETRFSLLGGRGHLFPSLQS